MQYGLITQCWPFKVIYGGIVSAKVNALALTSWKETCFNVRTSFSISTTLDKSFTMSMFGNSTHDYLLKPQSPSLWSKVLGKATNLTAIMKDSHQP